MHKIKFTYTNKLWRLLLVIALILPSFSPLGTTDVKAGGIPILGLIPALIKRNKVYRSANAFIKDRAIYYDALRDTAAQQLLDRELTFGLRDNQVAAYTKVVALIEQERDSMYDFAESEKKAAHDKWIDAVQDQINGVMLSTTPAVRVLSALSRGINSSQGLIDVAINKITGGGGGVLEDIAKVKRIADRISMAGGVIGGDVGKTIQRIGGKIGDLTRPLDQIEADLIKVKGELGEIGGMVSGLQEQGWTTIASPTRQEVAIHLVTGESTNPAIEAIADMVVASHGTGGNIRERARDIMLGDASLRCRIKVDQIQRVLFKLETEPASEDTTDMGDFPSCEAVDITSLVENVEEAADADQGSQEETEAAGETSTSDPDSSNQADTGVTDQAAETDDSQPQEGESDEAWVPSSENEYIWVLVSSVTNHTNERTSFVGGTGDPAYFGEARFAGKSLDYTTSEGFFSVHAVDVDHGYTYSDTTVSVSFDSPPARLEPGQEISLSASASHGGSVNEGGSGLGLLFQYSYLKRALEPILDYRPYNPSWQGSASQDWTFTAPSASSPDSKFELWAGLWNSPPCNIVWTYQAQPNPNWTEAPDGEETSEVDRGVATDPWAEQQCAILREDVASKVSIARGADTADLALGIIGHLIVSKGDVQINYCEGGSGSGEKNVPIRIGDCVKTGSDGRALVILNDQDNKYNAEPTRMGVSRNSELCFDGFSVHRDDGKPGLIDHLKGAIRVFTEGWRPDSGFGVNVSIKAAVTVASDVVLEYDPDLDLLHTYVNEGNVEVEDLNSGESETLSDNQLLVSPQGSIGSVERMSSRAWKDLIEDQGLDLEEEYGSSGESSSPLKGFNLPTWAIVLIVGGICGGGLILLGGGAFILYQRRKKKDTIEE